MLRSAERILTTHSGSLPRPRDLLAPLHAKDAGDPYDRTALADRVRASVRDVVRRQIDLGIDIVDDGEHSKSSFAMYARARFGGLERTTKPQAHAVGATRDSLAFPDVYEDMRVMFAARTAASGTAARHDGAALHRTRQIYRTGRSARGHREPESRACGHRGQRGVHHCDLSDQSRNVFSERILQIRGRISGSPLPTP